MANSSRDNNGGMFGLLLARRIRAANLSQSAASWKCGFDHSYFSRLISGTRMPSRETVDQIADGLGWTDAERRTALIAAGFLPGDILDVMDSDVLELATALARAEAFDPVWAGTVRENTRALARTANLLADMHERIQAQ